MENYIYNYFEIHSYRINGLLRSFKFQYKENGDFVPVEEIKENIFEKIIFTKNLFLHYKTTIFCKITYEPKEILKILKKINYKKIS